MSCVKYLRIENVVKKKRSKFLMCQLLCLLMALHLVNLRIDGQDKAFTTGRIASHKDLSVNKIESISEFLLEECLGIRDAVPEQDDPEEDSELTELEQDYEFTQFFVFTPLRSPATYQLTKRVPFRPAFISAHVPEIIAPPPQPAALASVPAYFCLANRRRAGL